jgi:hypothetical protein
MFRRLVVYFYEYIQGEKKDSCGYAKLNIHDGECRGEIKLNHAPWLDKEVNISFYHEENENYVLWEAAAGKMEMGRLNLKFVCAAENAAENLKGILVYDGSDMMKIICGTPDGEEENFEKFRNVDKIAENSENKEENVEKIKKTEKLSTQNLTFPQKNVKNSEDSDNSVYEYDEECLKQKEQAGKDVNQEKKPTSCWQEKLFRLFPKIMICIDGEQTSGIRLRPHDMIWFPKSYWRMASNNFLLNGYYQYRYLLFFQGGKEEEKSYYLGVPGGFSVSEAVTAKQYGFTDFFRASGCTPEKAVFGTKSDRNFGFWCLKT